MTRGGPRSKRLLLGPGHRAGGGGDVPGTGSSRLGCLLAAVAAGVVIGLIAVACHG